MAVVQACRGAVCDVYLGPSGLGERMLRCGDRLTPPSGVSLAEHHPNLEQPIEEPPNADARTIAAKGDASYVLRARCAR